MSFPAYAPDPYRSETAAEARARKAAEYAEAEANAERRKLLAEGSAATIRALLSEHVAEEPLASRHPAEHAAWRAELDTLARAYVAALDREARR